MEERLPEGWAWTTLGEISTKPQYGWTTKAKRTEGTVLLLRTTDISGGNINWDSVPYCSEIPENVADYLLEAGDIVISRAGSVGLSYLLSSIPKPTVFASYLIRFRPFKEINVRYVAYYLQTSSYWNRIYEESSGIALANVNARKLETIEIPLSPLSEQHHIIAAIEQQFTRLDNAVASLQSAKTRVKQYRASLRKAAVEGELTKEWRAAHPAEETGAQLLARILTERRARWEEEQLAKMRERGITPKDDKWKQAYKEPQGPDVEQLPELPEGWRWATLESIAYIQLGKMLSPKAFEQHLIQLDYLRNENIRWGSIDYSDIKQMGFKEEELEKYSLLPNDLLVCEGGEPGRCAVYKENREYAGNEKLLMYQKALHRVRMIGNVVSPFFIQFCLQHYVASQTIIPKFSETTIRHLPLEKISVLSFPLPPLAEQEQIVAEVEAGLSNIAQMEETIEISLRRAEYERQSILREAFAGRLVPQNPEDEQASVLLERIREERKRREEDERAARKNRKDRQMAIAKKRRAGKAGLYATLVEAGRPLPPDDLFRGAGLKADDQPESVEVFYEELQDDVEDKLIAETRPDYEQVLLEALEPSAEVLARMQQEEAATRAREVEQDEKSAVAPALWNMELPGEP